MERKNDNKKSRKRENRNRKLLPDVLGPKIMLRSEISLLNKNKTQMM
jgi:hypothetical protein